jgi:hypothetical protein
LLETKGAGSAQGFGLSLGAAVIPNYIEEVFSTWLYTGTNSQQTITNGIDLAGEGGLVWVKSRSNSTSHKLLDSAQAGTATNWDYSLTSNSTAASTYYAQVPILAQATGFRINSTDSAFINESGYTYASWTFRKQPKFFDVVTYTGDGNSNRAVNHDLGSIPGCILLKRTDSATSWFVYHRSTGGTTQDNILQLNTTDALATSAGYWGTTAFTDTQFRVSSFGGFNASGGTYVAYLFAHNAGGFGLTGTDNVISCGSFTTDSSGNFTTSLGYEPQWILFKNSGASSNWNLIDTMRGWPVGTGSSYLRPNTSGAETTDALPYMIPTATGFAGINGGFGNTQTYIYIAIRRGPMKVPESGTEVYNAITRVGTGAVATVSGVGFSPDMLIAGPRGFASRHTVDRLRGRGILDNTSTGAEQTTATDVVTGYIPDGFLLGADSFSYGINSGANNKINWCFKRAPGFFDVVCYTGTGSATTVTHNLGVAPELMIVKGRSNAENWAVYTAPNKFFYLDSTIASVTSTGIWNNTAPSSTVFSLGPPSAATNSSGINYVAYLFATCAGVSKVGSYTGTGTTLQIDCGFTGGARFVMIKRTDSTGDWYVWDSARGIIAGNDPYLLLNSTAAEVTSTDYVDTYSAGFEISSTAPAAINASGGSFIFLALA